MAMAGLVVLFGLVDALTRKSPTVMVGHWHGGRGWFRLPLEEFHFFSLDKNQQFDRIADFIKTCHKETELMTI